MKKVGHISGMGVAGALMFCAIVGLGMAVPTQAQTGETYCEIKLSRCPEEYDKDTLRVPLDVVSMSSTIRACAATQIDDIGDPPAIMFIIDHTNSMGTLNDTRGNRYRVARELIDSVYAKIPAAEVGMVVFDAGLFLNSAKVTDPNLVTFKGAPYYNPDTAAEMYMPLMPLNKPALGGGFYTGTSAPNAIDVYRSMLVVGTNSGIRNPSGNGPNSILGNGRGTNVSIAFEAALEQFAKTGIAKENQYIIFISDGRYEMVAGGVPGQALVNGGCSGTAGTTVDGTGVGDGAYGNSVRCAKQRDFMVGQIGGQKIPTTYTVFLNTDADSVMRRNRATLDTMTTAINGNGYSKTNSSSDIWTANGNEYNELLTIMMDNIISKMLTQTMPKSLVVTSAGIRDSAGNLVDTFSFNRMLPIDTLSVSPVNMGITYEVVVDSTFTNPVTGLEDTVRTLTNKRLEYNFYIQRTANPPSNWDGSQGIVSTCRSKPTIQLLHGGQPVTVVKENMTNLTVQFETGGFFNYTKADVDSIQIFMVKGTSQDTLYTGSLRLDDLGAEFRWDFVRAKVSDDAQIVVGNTRLEHNTEEDSIVIFFRNPRIPLDVIRVVYPYVSHTMVFSERPNDLDARILDPKEVRAGETLDIYALLLNGEGAVDREMLESGTVTWSLSSADGAALSPDASLNSHAQFMATKTGEYVVTATFVSGGVTVTEKLTIKVVPGDPAYLEVVFKDPSANPPPVHADTTKLKQNKYLELPKSVRDTVLYAVERDRFGNLIGLANGSAWTKEGSGITLGGNSTASGSSSFVTRDGEAFTAGNKVIVRKGNMVDTVDVTVVGDASAAIGPNPFVPGVDSPRDIYSTHPKPEYKAVYEYYKKILDKPAVGGSGSGGGHSGILVAGTAPKEIAKDGKGDPKATIIIYDAVGNIVFRSKPNDVTLVEENNTFGFVWNGKNNKGRTVGPGTYLVRMSVELIGGKFVDQRRIGVTKSK